MAGKIFATGDAHGARAFSYRDPFNGYLDRLSSEAFREGRELDREDFVLFAGDFGGVWHFDERFAPDALKYLKRRGERKYPNGESADEKRDLDALADKPFTVLFCPGNHENYDRLYKAYPQTVAYGNSAVRIRENVLMLENGRSYEIAGKRVFSFGGAASHDVSGGILDPADFRTEAEFLAEREAWQGRQYRIRGISWWDEEIPPAWQMERGIAELERVGNKTDVVLTHCAPTSVQAFISAGAYEPDALTDYLQKIMDAVEYRHWIYGHYHDNRRTALKGDGSNEMMLYEQIVRLY